MKIKPFYFFSLFTLIACSGTEEIKKFPDVHNQYDPDKPVAVDKIIPTYGVIDETFIVEGNFPGNISDQKVYFGEKIAQLLSTDGKSIVGIVPKQPDGYNAVSVVVKGDSLYRDELVFKYKQSRSVKTISGSLGTDAWMSDDDYKSTNMDAATYGEVNYVKAIPGQKNDNIVIVGTGWGNKLLMLSQDDNKVTVLSSPQAMNSLAVTSTKDKFYGAKYWSDNGNIIYSYSKDDGWAMRQAGINITREDFPGTKSPSMTFAEDDNVLYLLNNEGLIAEIDLADKSYKIYCTESRKPASIDPNNFGGYINGELPQSFGDWMDSYICYSKFHKCFFVAFKREHAIFKYVRNADNSWTSELYAGRNGQGNLFGHRLDEAQFNNPHGMAVNEEGEIFVVNQNGHFISRIVGDLVELIAGKPGTSNPFANGDPLESVFDQPRDITIDTEGNYFIAGGNDRTVRKLSIE